MKCDKSREEDTQCRNGGMGGVKGVEKERSIKGCKGRDSIAFVRDFNRYGCKCNEIRMQSK